MSHPCVFCRIAAGELPARIVYETEQVLAFWDISPIAPVHILIIPRQHIQDTSMLDETTAPVMAEMFLAARDVAAREGIDDTGYRLLINTGRDGGQSVFHMHMHLLGGRKMRWPPG